MSRPLETGFGSDAPTRDEERPEPTTFTLSIVSPSTEVAGPLTFPHMLASTTVQELKAKIRDVVSTKPDDVSQRLIHRGRMLGDSQTMLQVFGQDSLSNPDTHTLHLVLRPPPPDSSTNTSASNPVSNTSQRAGSITSPPPALNPSRTSPSPNAMQGPQGHAFEHLHQNLNLPDAEHTHNAMTERLHQLQRETEQLQQEIQSGTRAYQFQLGRIINNIGSQTPPPPTVTRNPFQSPNMRTSIQQLIAEQQQRRAAEGRQLGQDLGQDLNRPSLSDRLNSGRSSHFRNPDHSTTYTREGVGPNGERWQVTVNETTTTIPLQHSRHRSDHNARNALPRATDPQQMMRNIDRFMAANPRNGAQRSLSNPPSARAEVHDFSSSTPPATVAPPNSNSPSSAVLLNPTATASAPNLTRTPTTAIDSTSTPTTDPMVYILTSPSGPRALLINNSESFYTPRISRHRQNNGMAAHIGRQAREAARETIGLPEYRNRYAQRARRGGRPDANNDEVPINFAQAHNRDARPGVPIAVRLFNTIWLIVRLVAFVWFFTSSNTSWPRFLMMIGLAVAVFIVNTGVFTGAFNGIADQLLGPIRRHLENLMPLAGPGEAQVPAAPQNAAAEANGQPRLRYGELDETQVAARLIDQRRQANGGWLMGQIRRAEHAALLFVASLIPGVGELHVAARDTAAREAAAAVAEVERQRLEAETAANGDNGNAGADSVEQQPEGATGGSEAAEGQQPIGQAAAQPVVTT